MCGHCVQLVTDIQEEVRTRPFFPESFVANAKQLCEYLGPSMADRVTILILLRSASSCGQGGTEQL